MSNVADSVMTEAGLDAIKKALTSEATPTGHVRLVSVDLVLQLIGEVERLRGHLRVAHRGLERALDFRTAGPDGLDIKEDVRDALRKSGNPGPWGYREQF